MHVMYQAFVGLVALFSNCRLSSVLDMGMKPSTSRPRTALVADKPREHPKAPTSSEGKPTATTAAAARKLSVPSRVATFKSSAAKAAATSAAKAHHEESDAPSAPSAHAGSGAPSVASPYMHPVSSDARPVTTQQDFFAAIIEGDADRVAECIADGAEVRPAHGNATHHTPILLACRLGRTNVLPLLIGGGADLESCDGAGRTALMSAIEKNRTSIMSLLLDGGANIRTVDAGYQTLLMLAIGSRCHEAAVRMLHAGALVDAKDHLQRTALTYAQLQQSEDNILTLLAAGANFKNCW